MDLHIDNATLEEISIICHRIGEVSIWEAAEEEKKEQIQNYQDQGMSKDEATEAFKKDIQEKADALTGLHLDAAPPRHTKDELAKLAGEYKAKFGTDKLRDALHRSGVKAIPEVKGEKVDELCKIFEEGLSE